MNTIWLVGASEGIGRSLALLLSSNPNNTLILSARNADRLADLAAEISNEKMSDHVSCFPFDVSDFESVMTAWNAIKQKHPVINTIIYCAGYYKPMSAVEMTADASNIHDIEKMIDVNLTGAFRVLNCITPDFIEQRNGNIVLVGSIAGYRGLPNSMGYGASKAGLIHLAENLKCDLSRFGINVQIINPGFVKTRLTDLNSFHMPSLISTEEAAQHIVDKMKKGKFESRFPFGFANAIKLIGHLPYWLYFRLMKRLS